MVDVVRVVRFRGLAAAAHLGVIPRVWIEECEAWGLEGHWARIAGSLRVYEFDHVLGLGEGDSVLAIMSTMSPLSHRGEPRYA